MIYFQKYYTQRTRTTQSSLRKQRLNPAVVRNKAHYTTSELGRRVRSCPAYMRLRKLMMTRIHVRHYLKACKGMCSIRPYIAFKHSIPKELARHRRLVEVV